MRIICTPAILCLISFSIKTDIVVAKRGPHHPKSEVDKGRQKMDEHFAHGIDHIQEDLEQSSVVQNKNVSEMTEEEKNFYYFKLHDTDNNDVLDGLELLHAATHHSVHIDHGDENGSENNEDERNENEIGHIIGIIDDFIQYADFNNDGYLNYPEYAQAMEHNNSDKSITNHVDVT